MDPSRTPLSPGSHKRRRGSPSGDLPMGSQSQHQQTSLPSIRQLAFLPPSSSMPQHLSSESSSYSYPTASHYPSHIGRVDIGPSHGMGGAPQREGGYVGGDSEADEDQRGPPKKKRRRQALSCTECKRRKIKCDRTQPCAPCTRRGEESGCQWHIVEPVEKYATKAEFDDLKSRFEILSDLVQRLLPPAAAASVPYYQMGVSAAMPGVAGEAVQSFNSGTSGPIGYSSMMPPPSQPPQQQQGYTQHMETSSQATNRYMKPEGTQSPTRHIHQSLGGIPTTSPIISSALHNSPLARHRHESSPTSAAATVKSSALSLASITTPYLPDPSHLQQAQSKNYHAQTLILGERLRPGSEDPMNTFAKTRPTQEHQLATPLTRRCISKVPRRRRRVPHLRLLTKFSLVHHGGLVIRPRAQGTTTGPA